MPPETLNFALKNSQNFVLNDSPSRCRRSRIERPLANTPHKVGASWFRMETSSAAIGDDPANPMPTWPAKLPKRLSFFA
jgi:hypothetical protein